MVKGLKCILPENEKVVHLAGRQTLIFTFHQLEQLVEQLGNWPLPSRFPGVPA